MSTKQQIQEYALKCLTDELQKLNYISGVVGEILQANGYQDTQGKFNSSLHQVNKALAAAKKDISQANQR